MEVVLADVADYAVDEDPPGPVDREDRRLLHNHSELTVPGAVEREISDSLGYIDEHEVTRLQ